MGIATVIMIAILCLMIGTAIGEALLWRRIVNALPDIIKRDVEYHVAKALDEILNNKAKN